MPAIASGLITARLSVARLSVVCLVALSLCVPAQTAAAWETAHGKPDNTGFADVATAPAKDPRILSDLGSFAPGAGPVVAADGTVYVGTEQGKLLSFKPDGTPGWSRSLNRGEAIYASPAIGADGSIYVIGVRQYTDHRVEPPAKVVATTLHRFTASGGWASQTPFPDHAGGGLTTASPNLWRFNGAELVMVPALYKRAIDGGVDVRLLAFAPDGGLVADQRATSLVPETTGGGDLPGWAVPLCVATLYIGCLLGVDYAGTGPYPPPPPFPGIAIHTNPQGGTPWIALSDHHKDLVGFTFSLADHQFREVFRVHDDNRFLRSAPGFLPEARSIVGSEDIFRDSDGAQSGAEKGGAVLSGPNQNKAGPITGLQHIYGSATRLKDGRTALLGAHGELTLLNGIQVTRRLQLNGFAIVGAAASRTHLFVSTSAAFYTFDPASMTEAARFDRAGGGWSQPAIGPFGHVYAILGRDLAIFAPPANQPISGAMPDGSGAAPQPASVDKQSFKDPLTANNNRLFACERPDGDDCGKGDHRAIAKAFCQGKGFGRARDFDVKARKVKAETLDGQFCSKNKCKVFEEIVCAKE